MKNTKRGISSIFVSILAIIQKNFKTVFRSKSSAFIIIFGPLLIMALISLAFNNSSLFDIRLASYSEGYSPLSEGIINQLENKSYFVDRLNSTDDCLNGVKNGEYNACVVFSKAMEITNEGSNNITFYVDPSRMNIVYNIISDINKEVTRTSTNLSLGLTNTIVDQLLSTKDELNNKVGVLNTINSNNNKISDDANSIKSKLDGVDLNIVYDDFKVSELRDKINSINSTYNLTTADYDSINGKIGTIDTQINSAISKASGAKTKVNEASGSLSSISSTSISNAQDVGVVKTSIEGLVSGINSIQVTNPENIVTPINTKVKQVEAQSTHLGRFLPTFLVLIIMFICILLSSSLVLEEKMSSAYFRNSISATPSGVFLFGTYITSFIITLFHIIVISIVLNFVVGYSITLLLSAIVPLLFITSMFILLGIIIGYFASSQEGSNVIS